MSWRGGDLEAYWRARALSRRDALVMLAAWMFPVVVSGLGVPLRRDGTDMPAEIDSLGVLAFVVPVAAAMRLLEEGPVSLVRTRVRRLTWPRALIATLTVVVTGAGAAASATVVSLPLQHSIALVVTQSSLGVLGTTGLGPTRGWLMPGGLTLLATAPGVVPWRGNLFYNGQRTGELTLLAVTLTAVAVMAYARSGLSRARSVGD